MSFLTYRVPVLRTALPAATSRVAGARSFGVSASRAALSENEVNQEGRGSEAAKHAKQGSNKEWKRELASSSEAAVKADRGEVDASQKTIKDLQKEAEKVGKKDN